MYIESDAWVTNLKQKLACGSVLMSNQMEFFEFFTRALKPGVHYIEVDSRNLCHDAAVKVNCATSNFLVCVIWAMHIWLLHCIDTFFVTVIAQVKAMNAAIKKDSQGETMEEKDADSRRFLKETAQNYTEAPWEVGKAGQQVINPFSPSLYVML